LAEHVLGKDEVTGSSPVIGSRFRSLASLAGIDVGDSFFI
jgi:hypothetical protein